MVVTLERPWISDQALAFIERRLHARAHGLYDEERALNHRVRICVKRDREVWLRDMAGSNDWSKLRRLRRGETRSPGRVHDENGMPVSFEHRAETFARHLAEVQ